MAVHPPLCHRDGLAWRDPLEGAHLDPLGVDRGHGWFEVTELLQLLAVEPALTTGLLWRFVVAAVLFAIAGVGRAWSTHCSSKWAGLQKRAKRDLSRMNVR